MSRQRPLSINESDCIVFLDELRGKISELSPESTTQETIIKWREIDRDLDHAICMVRATLRKKESEIASFHEQQRIKKEKKELEEKKRAEKESVEHLLGAIRNQVPDLKQVNLKMFVSLLKKEQRRKSPEKAAPT